MVYPILSAILAIFAFNSSWNFFILVALAPFFWFLTQEQKFWKLIAGTAVFRLIFSLGTVYFVIDPFLYFLSILIFLGLPVSFYLIRRYWSSEIAVWSLPILWTVWDYLEAQYTFLPMTIMMLGNSLAESPFLGLAKFDGIIGLTFFAALINTLILALILNRKSEKTVQILLLILIGSLLLGRGGSDLTLRQNKNLYFSKNNFLSVELLSAAKTRDKLDNALTALVLNPESDLLVVAENFYKTNLDNYGEIINFYQQLAKKLSINVSAISIRKDDGKVYKSSLFFSSKGDILDIYDKKYLTITSEYWPLGNWRPFYMKSGGKFPPAGRAVFDPNYQHARGRLKIIRADNFSFASPICSEFHYPDYLKELNQLNPDFIIHNSNNDWIDFGLNQYLRLTNNLRRIEAVHFQKPVLVSGIKDYAGIFYPDGTSELVYPKNGFSLVNVEVRF